MMDINNLCMGCMNEFEQPSIYCPHCGYKAGTVNSSRGLQPQTILNGKYLVGKIIGEGGFGITYIAYDLILNSRVAIKEYFPSELVTRDTSTGMQTSLTVLTNAKGEQYKAGIERFVKEAQNLAKFNSLEGIVSVKEFFYENNTAYMVMEYIEGVTLSKYLESYGNKLPYDQVIKMITPVMDSLEKVHADNIVHRDISPDNTMVTNNGTLKLIDFGAARIVDNTDQKSLTVILKHGYAPEEQYQSHGNQGPWTDIYALSATMYRMITGIVPQESTDRVLSGDKVVPINKLVPEVPKMVSDAIMHGLAVKATNRPKTISAFKHEMQKGRRKVLPLILGIAATVAVLIIGIAGLIIAINLTKKPQDKDLSEQTTSESEVELEEITSEIKSETPEVKELTEEEKLAQWREYQDKILDTLGVSFVIPNGGLWFSFDEDGLYGCYDDFDLDGDYELFWYMYYGLMGSDYGEYIVFFSDDNGVWMENDGKLIPITKESEEVKNFQNYYEKDRKEYGNYFLCAEKMETTQLGKQKICYYRNEYGFYGDYCCTVWQQEPQYYQGGIYEKEDILFCGKDDKIHYYTSKGEGVLFGNINVYYSPYFYNGQFGEFASCLITPEQYSNVPELVNQINVQAEYVKKNNSKQLSIYLDDYTGGVPDGYTIEDVSIDSVLYNEAGYYVFNYKCSCTFDEIHSAYEYSWSKGKPYYASMIGNWCGEVIYTGSPANINNDPIEGLYAYVIVKYDGKTYTFVESDSGYVGTAVTDNVLATSKCPYIQ